MAPKKLISNTLDYIYEVTLSLNQPPKKIIKMITLIICYTPTKIISEKITLKVLKLKLASCVSISKNIESMYMYKKKLCKENEYKLTIKTKKTKIKQLITYLKKIHPYKKINITIIYI